MRKPAKVNKKVRKTFKPKGAGISKSQRHTDSEARARLDDALQLSGVLSELVRQPSKAEQKQDQKKKAEAATKLKEQTNNALLEQLEAIENFDLK